jgi:hypothetical protein
MQGDCFNLGHDSFNSLSNKSLSNNPILQCYTGLILSVKILSNEPIINKHTEENSFQCSSVSIVTRIGLREEHRVRAFENRVLGRMF